MYKDLVGKTIVHCQTIGHDPSHHIPTLCKGFNIRLSDGTELVFVPLSNNFMDVLVVEPKG